MCRSVIIFATVIQGHDASLTFDGMYRLFLSASYSLMTCAALVVPQYTEPLSMEKQALTSPDKVCIASGPYICKTLQAFTDHCKKLPVVGISA